MALKKIMYFYNIMFEKKEIKQIHKVINYEEKYPYIKNHQLYGLTILQDIKG